MRTHIALAVSLVLCACAEPTSDPPTQEDVPSASFEDPEVARIWERMMEVKAPDRGWDRARYLEFDWAVHRDDADPAVRSHRWDRWEGRARVQSEVDGGPMVALFQVDRPEEGRVWLDGEELTGEEARERLAQAHRSHVNDAYWLLMPYKWTDPGVHLRYLGAEEDEDGRRWEVVELSFDDGTGLTPQNRYRAFVNPESGRMERWHFLRDADTEPSPSDWTDWRRVGPIELAENRRVDGQPRIFFPHLRVETEVPEGAFAPPE